MGNDVWLHGRAIDNRGTSDAVLRYTSVSQISSADPDEEGCLRKFHYEKVLGKARPKTKQTMRGDELHDVLRDYLHTGDRSKLSPLALRGMHMVMDPIRFKEVSDGAGGIVRVPDMLVEWDMLLRPGDAEPAAGLDLTNPEQRKLAEARAAEALSRAAVRLAGVPLLGRMDVVNPRGENKGATDIEDTRDPPGTIEVCDWKSTGSPQWILRPKDLPKKIQMAGYGLWVREVEPRVQHIRLSHGYFVEAGGPSRKVSLRVLPEDIEPACNRGATVVRSMIDAAKEADVDKVPANLKACGKYGGCTHREYCKASMHQALSAFVGQTMADKLRGQREGSTMGLMDKLKADTMSAPAAPAGGLNLGALVGGNTAPAQPDAAAIAAEKAKLEAEEKAQRAAAQLRAESDRMQPLVDEFAGYCKANDFGFPKFTGRAAEVIATPIAASGKLADTEVESHAMLEGMLTQMRQAAAQGQIKPPAQEGGLASGLGALLAPETPAPSKPVAHPGANAVGGTGENAAAPTEPQKTEAKPDPEPEKAPAKTRAKKTEPKSDVPPLAPAGTAITLYVDCAVEGVPGLQSFNAILDMVCANLIASTGDADVMCANEKSPIAFGKWEGAIAAMLRETAIAPGSYLLYTRGSRVAEVAGRVMGEICRKSGGALIWGGR